MTGALNGKYVLERRLGGGGMAEVFLARTVGVEGFSRQVAVKRVRAGLSDDPRFASMFVSEAQLTSRFQHSNVVSVLDFDRDNDGRLFLVMELVNGIDLDAMLATGPLELSLVLYIAVEILRGLDYAHDLPVNTDGIRGVVHRDISPHNILLSWEGEVKVSDFGIAKARAATNVTASEVIKGKPAYMSPEQARGWPLDGRSDVFAVGVMLFEMLCGRPLFSADSTEATLAQLWFSEIPTVRSQRPDVPEDLSRVIDWMLKRGLDERAPSAAAVIEALIGCHAYPRDGREDLTASLAQRFVGRAPSRARNVSRTSPADQTLVPSSVSGLSRRRRTRTGPTPFSSHGAIPRADRRWVWAVLASVALVGGAVGVIMATGGSGTQATPPAAATTRAGPEERRSSAPTSPPGPELASPPAVHPMPTPARVGDGSADAALPPVVPKARGSAAQPEPALTSPVPTPRPPPRAAPKTGGIKEIHLSPSQ